MNSLARTLIEKTGYDNGFEIIQKSELSLVSLGSSLHPIKVDIATGSHEGAYVLQFSGNLSLPELKRGLSKEFFLNDRIEVWSRDLLGVVLKRAAELGISLPDGPIRHYDERLNAYLQKKPGERPIFGEMVTPMF